MSITGEWEYAPLRIPSGTGRSAAAQMMSLQSDVGGWELAKLQMFADGTRRVVMRRRARLSYLPRPAVAPAKEPLHPLIGRRGGAEVPLPDGPTA
ncbi:DUF5703 family protein [Klenkia terrae]